MALFPVTNAMGGKKVHPINTESTLNGCLVTLRQRRNGGPANHPVRSEARCIRLNQSVHVGGHLVTVGEHCYDVTANNLPANWYPHALPAEEIFECVVIYRSDDHWVLTGSHHGLASSM
ncbi:uncharacterized protein PpBr36_11385 [Pyricularia pennisetigena]|uniref:uncharacterized protein n=1 Tax=Pyricularia pennisetigena TaxID=1578925 RepID=UPI00114E81A9|nr:uncharacterized protein PpBr36_11385 [Pyricularia pennisetigena]TLS20414.1 hypothetical protein PpBr36_11385 [Pyricularia pennisetigena]